MPQPFKHKPVPGLIKSVAHVKVHGQKEGLQIKGQETVSNGDALSVPFIGGGFPRSGSSVEPLICLVTGVLGIMMCPNGYIACTQR